MPLTYCSAEILVLAGYFCNSKGKTFGEDRDINACVENYDVPHMTDIS